MNRKAPLILAIDTSCDETSVAICQGRRVLANVVSSQTELHKKWGGVVPRIAKRAHQENLPPSVNEALKRAKLDWSKIGAIAVTYGPGLAIDLEVGIAYAQEQAVRNRIPLIPVNHMEGHLYSSLILNSAGGGPLEKFRPEQLFPALGLLISGKHTELIYVETFGKHRKIGWTVDDAAGEAFDKIGRMLNFGYPGGPIVSAFAKRGQPNKLFDLPLPMSKSKDLNLSYSGLKTACLYRVNELREQGLKDSAWAEDFCYAFVEAIVETIQIKYEKALKIYPDVKSVLTGGGVLHNERIARKMGSIARSHGKIFGLPEKKFRSDNAAMIGLVGWTKWKRGEILSTPSEISSLDRIPRLSL